VVNQRKQFEQHLLNKAILNNQQLLYVIINLQ